MSGKDIEVNVSKKADPQLEREKLESDRRALIEQRAEGRAFIPNEIEGLMLSLLSPFSAGFLVTALLAVLDFPVVLVGALLLGSGSVFGALAYITRSDAQSQRVFAVIAIAFLVGSLGGLNNERLKASVEPSRVPGHSTGVLGD